VAENNRHFCMLIGPKESESGTRAALLEETRWKEPGQTIRVRFIAGDPDLQDRIRSVAEEWVGLEMANLQWEFVDGGPADIRIALTPGDGSWSYLGTVCQQIDPGEPTMNYGWLTPDSPDDEVRRVVLHEFGHALGLIHEHQNPNRPISWNRAAVVADLSQPPNSWDEATIENNIFKRYEGVTATPTDPSSIMMYPIPASWTTDGFSAGFNKELSGVDREFIRSAYPW
jgi:serralysin